MRAALWALVFALITPLTTRADDHRADIAALKHDLPILLNLGGQVTFDDFSFIGNGVRVRWAIGHYHQTNQLYKKYGRWWLVPGFWFSEDPSPQPSCDPKTCIVYIGGHEDPDSSFRGTALVRDGIGRPLLLTDDNYKFGLHFAASDEPDAAIVDFRARAPTEAESWANPPSGNAYFFFSGMVQSPQPVHVQFGTTLDVWFPFVLDASLRYSLTIAAPNVMSLGPVEGTLKDNTLHFVLPAFTAPPGAELMGEIDSD